MKLARWNLKCQKRLKRHAKELRNGGNLGVESTMEAIQDLAGGMEFETNTWGKDLQELRKAVDKLESAK